MSSYGTPERSRGNQGMNPSSSGSQSTGQHMAQAGGATSGGAHAHAVAFRVMRLCRPALHVEAPMRLAESDLRADPPPGVPMQGM